MQSIHSQRYSNLEHFVFDARSSDETSEILKQYDDHIYWISEKDDGQSNAINKGFRKVTGDIVAWQNADDLYESDTFEFVSSFFKENPHVGLIYGAYYEIDELGKRLSTVKAKSWNEYKFKYGRFCPVQPTVFWRKEVLDKVGLLDESLNYCMDVDFYSRVLKGGFNIKGINKVLGSFRVHQESKTQNLANRKSHKKEYLKVLKKHFRYGLIERIIFELYYYRSQLAMKFKRYFAI